MRLLFSSRARKIYDWDPCLSKLCTRHERRLHDQRNRNTGSNSDKMREKLLVKFAAFCKIARMSEQTIHMEVVPQVSLELHLRGDPPALEMIKYSNSADRSDTASRLQQRCLNKAVAT